VAEIDGMVSDIKEGETEGERFIVVVGDGKKKEAEHEVAPRRTPIVKPGQEVKAGDLLTDGHADINMIFKYGGKAKAEKYVINEITKIYETQGASISRKHIEIIVRQMFSRLRIKEVGDTYFSIGDIVEEAELLEENRRVKEEGGEPAKEEQLVLGITEVSLNKESWLSAASFQHTSRVLIDAAIRGSVDRLRGMKENVILGRLIPAGTGIGAQAEAIEETTEEEEA
jgi:DNA-directed RNA polymerase subunit beta'